MKATLHYRLGAGAKRREREVPLRLGFRGTVRTLESLCFAWSGAVEECQLPSPTAALFQEGRGRKAAIALHSRCSETLAHTTPIEVVLARAHTPATERGWSELLCLSGLASDEKGREGSSDG